MNNENYLDERLAKQLIETGVLRHDDEKCFWTDTYYSSKDEMESIYQRYRLKIVDHFAQDGLAPLLSKKLISGTKISSKHGVIITIAYVGNNQFWEQVIMLS